MIGKHPVRIGCLVALICFLLSCVADHFLFGLNLSRETLHLIFSIIIGGLCARVLEMERQRWVTLQQIAHHTGNAVQILMYREAIPAEKREVEVDKACRRLQWVVQVLLPQNPVKAHEVQSEVSSVLSSSLR